ncbi:hypothetical protein M8C21_024198 [Ambrosia artemisiifolia]|uniref:Uncharacterized protein n=1 Tax=Ambrosia artemisiifolia TaxID=4212 RepID=A0AAD5G4V2_AMBAR|nr:hypothetical protein M8C21_024198 [Ambrosia artemisiifolia]
MNATTTIVVASKASILEVNVNYVTILLEAIDPVKYKSISSGFGVLLKEQGVKTLIYLAGSAFAELIADVALCPMEAVKVRVQTRPVFARGLGDGLPKSIRFEGAVGLYKGLVPLWGRQIPCVLCAIVSHPADNHVSFLNNAVKKLGVWVLFTRWLPLRIVMVGTLTRAQWGIYDAFEVFVGLPSTGGLHHQLLLKLQKPRIWELTDGGCGD